MIIVLENNALEKDVKLIEDFLKKYNLELNKIKDFTYLVSGDTSVIDEQSVKNLEKVYSVHRITPPYKLASRNNHPNNTIVSVNGIDFGGKEQIVIAGPCSIESQEQIDEIARICKESGVKVLRGGAYKPRTSPYFFQGLGEVGLKYLHEAGKKYGLSVVSEIVNINDLDLFMKYVDIIQVGARNMQNFELLKALGKVNKPILLKRNPASTIEEWLLSAEYILKNGNPNVILCERGVKGFDKTTRYSIDFGQVEALKSLTHLPIVIDPSHASGDYRYVPNLVLASFAIGADGIMIEVHNDPLKSVSDGAQTLKASKLKELIIKGKEIGKIIGR